MRIRGLVAGTALVLGLGVLPLSATAGTIGEGQVRVVEGKISAVDPKARAVVVEVPSKKGDMTVGVTLEQAVTPKSDGKPVNLEDVAAGNRARLKYTRKGDQLVGLELTVRK